MSAPPFNGSSFGEHPLERLVKEQQAQLIALAERLSNMDRRWEHQAAHIQKVTVEAAQYNRQTATEVIQMLKALQERFESLVDAATQIDDGQEHGSGPGEDDAGANGTGGSGGTHGGQSGGGQGVPT